jgi:hypothetical protein
MDNTHELVWIANGSLDANMICNLLKSFDIDTITTQESAGATYGMAYGPLGEVKIYVPKEKVGFAKEILSAYEKGDLESRYPPAPST